MDYQKIANEVIKNVGGNANIVSTLSCFTRLRIEVRNKELVNQEAIKGLEGVKGGTFFQNTYQVIFGEKVADIYKEIEALRAGKTLQEESAPIEETKKSFGGKILDYIQGSIQPVITVFIGCGLIQGIIALMAYLNVDSTTFGYQTLSVAGSCGYYFLPILLGFSSAKKLKINPYIGAVIGALLVYPSMVEIAGSGEAFASLYGLPVKLVDYTSSITPILLTMPVVYWIEKFARKISPNILKPVLVPAICILLSIPVMLVVTAPIAQYISELVGKGMTYLYANAPVFAGLIIGAVAPFLVLTGAHNAAVVPIALNEFLTTGSIIMFPVLAYGNAAVAGAALGVAAKTKNRAFRGESASSALIGAIGISEPAMFGILLPTKRPFIAVGIMSGICGMISVALQVKAWGFGLCGIGGIPVFLGPTFGYWAALMLLSFVGSAIIAYLIGFKDIEEEI